MDETTPPSPVSPTNTPVATPTPQLLPTDKPSDLNDTDAPQTQQLKPTITRGKKRIGPKDHLKPYFLEEYKKCENETMAAKNVGVDRSTVWNWKQDKTFMAAFTKAHLEAVAKNNDALKGNSMQLAMNGNPHYLIDKRTGAYIRDAEGNRVIAYREFYPQLNMFLLKNRMADEFKDKFEHEINGKVIMELTTEFFSIIRRNVPELCPHCNTRLDITPAIKRELENVSAKLGAAS